MSRLSTIAKLSISVFAVTALNTELCRAQVNTTNTVAPAAVTAERPGEIQSSDSTNQTAGEFPNAPTELDLDHTDANVWPPAERGRFMAMYGVARMPRDRVVQDSPSHRWYGWQTLFEPKTGTKSVSFSGRF